MATALPKLSQTPPPGPMSFWLMVQVLLPVRRYMKAVPESLARSSSWGALTRAHSPSVAMAEPKTSLAEPPGMVCLTRSVNPWPRQSCWK